jgi:regulator of RNase E activity RraA
MSNHDTGLRRFEGEIAMNEFPDWLASTLASDATGGQGVLPPWIGSLKPDARAVGPAFVALMSQDDNLSVREAIQTPHSPGSVLVVGGGSTSRTATIGRLMALEMQNAVLLSKADANRQQDNARLVRL